MGSDLVVVGSPIGHYLTDLLQRFNLEGMDVQVGLGQRSFELAVLQLQFAQSLASEISMPPDLSRHL